MRFLATGIVATGAIVGGSDRLRALFTAVASSLSWRAPHCSVRTEYAAVAREWSQQRPTGRALVEPLAGVRRHCLDGGSATVRAGDRRLKYHCRPRLANLNDLRARLAERRRLEPALAKTVFQCSGDTAPAGAVLSMLEARTALCGTARTSEIRWPRRIPRIDRRTGANSIRATRPGSARRNASRLGPVNFPEGLATTAEA